MGHLEKKITYSNNMPFKMGTLDLLSKYGVDDFVECDKPRSGESGVLIVYSEFASAHPVLMAELFVLLVQCFWNLVFSNDFLIIKDH